MQQWRHAAWIVVRSAPASDLSADLSSEAQGAWGEAPMKAAARRRALFDIVNAASNVARNVTQ
jgi:hypothetical protein